MYEVVHTLTAWYDGPRCGIADYHGNPHLFESEWKDGEDLATDSFLLTPIDSNTLALALEDWAIWRRWETAFHQGRATHEFHPALPEDRARHEELKKLLAEHLVTDPARAVRVQAVFRNRDDEQWSGYGWHPMEVCWSELLSTGSKAN